MEKNIEFGEKNSFSIGQKLEIEIEKIVFGGEGLGRVDGFAIFVPMSVPGDIVEIELISLKKSYGRGLITKIIKPGAERIDNIEKITFEDFDGCDFGMLKYENQLKYKEEMLREVLNQIGHINFENIEIESIIGSDIETNYRNKTAEPIFKKDKKIQTGFYSKKSHDIFVAKEHLLRSEIAGKIIHKFLEEVNSFTGTNNEFKVYNEKSETGFLKHIVVRNNEKNETMLIIVVNKKSQYKLLVKVLEKLYNEVEEIKSVYISMKKENNNVILGEESRHLFGAEYLEEEIEGIKFKIYPDSFFQINKSQAVKLYNKAIEYFGESLENKVTENLFSKNLLPRNLSTNNGNVKGTVIDAFSGTGTIAMILAKSFEKVIGIESVESSVNAGNITIKENGLNHVTLLNGKVEKILPEILKKEKIEGIIFDPPRRGIDEKALKSVIKNRIPKMVYISCNPATFARDCKFMIENGYKLEKVTPVDMFPQTSHLEVVGLLKRVR